jgi:hypothetical protein
MRTTIDLPDALFRQVKSRAALEGRTLKDLLAEYVEQGLRQTPGGSPPVRRSDPPVFPRAAATGQRTPALTNAEMNAILDEEDAERCLRLARR